KRFAVLGDMLELGQFSEEAHRQIGIFLADKLLSGVLVFGPFSRHIVESLKKAGSSMYAAYFDDHKKLAAELDSRLQKGDALLLKGSRGMAMEKILTYLPERR
ncbi:MAG: UDP-N-acetylmuramoyl-tripeptide--D-alanyl-D-alanine ligase, partial [Calditrichia bacterium]